MFSCVFVTYPYVVLGQVWYLIVWIPDLYLLPYIGCYPWKECLEQLRVHPISFEQLLVLHFLCPVPSRLSLIILQRAPELQMGSNQWRINRQVGRFSSDQDQGA